MKVLFVTEPDFMTRHVGVRRVILHYARRLAAANWTVEFGAAGSGRIVLGEVDIVPVASQTRKAATPAWSSKQPALKADRDASPWGRLYSARWTAREINPDDYDTIVITAPWVCALGVPPLPRVAGIVYDLVPNLLAAGCLRLSRYLDAFDFARQHDLGYRYYLANASRVTCISESTLRDFRDLYRTAANLPSLVCDIPFEVTGVPAEGEKNTVLLVNALDWRKNLVGMERALSLAASRRPIRLRVVGEERIEQQDALKFFERMAEVCEDVEWYREADDAILAHQYDRASVLFFPSFYEGLGLPVLEAEERGKPVITSDVSSCVEVNMNPSLCVNPDDANAMAEKIVEVLDRSVPMLTGNTLAAALKAFLVGRSDPVSIFDLSSVAGVRRSAGVAA